jgi:thiol-disulfide isomerase/thioredoxin
MLVRIGIALLIIGVSLAAYMLGTHWQMKRVVQQQQGKGILTEIQNGIPAIIYFWSDGCVPCKVVQSPALKQLYAKLGPDSIQVIEIDALRNPEIADAWGVLGLPTTFIVDAAGQPRHVNHGVARIEQLERQLTALG